MSNENTILKTRSAEELAGAKSLGSGTTSYVYTYDPSLLETFVNKHAEHDYVVTFDCTEGTSLCLSGDTLIDVARNESLFPHGIPIRDLVGTEGYVFSVDPDTLEPVVKKYTDVRCTGVGRPVVQVNMQFYRRSTDSWEHSSITCTEDHLFLVKDGFTKTKWVKASDLKPDMQLVYSRHTEGSDVMRNEVNRHRAIAAAIYGESAIEGMEIHHINKNHFDNRPENLANLTPSEHKHLHRSDDYQYDATLNVDELIGMYNSGMSIKAIADYFECDFSTIQRRIAPKVELRNQAESLKLRNRTPEIEERNAEICSLYNKGYLIKELSEYFRLHGTRISEILKENGISIVESNAARVARAHVDLPSLNHKIVSVVPAGYCDVYNMEVESTHCFFANDVIVHNCPKTHQPDFFKAVISYIPRERMLESKSAKLYLGSFRNTGSFHEDVCNTIGKDLVSLLDPKYLEVRMIYSVRGGIALYPFFNYADASGNYDYLLTQRKLDILRDGANRSVKYDM